MTQQQTSNAAPERSRGERDTKELKSSSALELLVEAQEILTSVVAPNRYAVKSAEATHEQTRQALNLVLRAVSILRQQARREVIDDDWE